ncbi:MAG TPA: DUF3574 domain-containing protein [Lysobacter sp.]
MPPPSAAMQGDAARPAQAQDWVRSELYFGVGNEDGTDAVSEAQWRAFLDREVTPRFPDGLTVLDGYGQWLFRDRDTLVRQRSKILVVLHERNARRAADIEAIRLAWKQATRHQSVLWSQQAATVSF